MSLLIALAALQAFSQIRQGPLASGQWSYTAQAAGSEARFGASLSLRCDRTLRRVRITRLDTAGVMGALTISTETMAVTVPPDGWLEASSPLLDAMAFARGRFVVDGGGGVRLRIPIGPEATRSIEDCRN